MCVLHMPSHPSRTELIDSLQPPYEPEIKRMLDKSMPPGSGMELLALFRTLACHDELASRSRPVGAGILAKGLLQPRLRGC